MTSPGTDNATTTSAQAIIAQFQTRQQAGSHNAESTTPPGTPPGLKGPRALTAQVATNARGQGRGPGGTEAGSGGVHVGANMGGLGAGLEGPRALTAQVATNARGQGAAIVSGNPGMLAPSSSLQPYPGGVVLGRKRKEPVSHADAEGDTDMERDRPTLAKRNRNAQDNPPFAQQDAAPPKFAPMYIVMPQADGFRAFQFSAENLQLFTAENLPVFSADAFQSYAPGAAVTPAGVLGLPAGDTSGDERSTALQTTNPSRNAPVSPRTPRGHKNIVRRPFLDDGDGDDEESDDEGGLVLSQKAKGKRPAGRQEYTDEPHSAPSDGDEGHGDKTPTARSPGLSDSRARSRPPPRPARSLTEPPNITHEQGGPQPRPSTFATQTDVADIQHSLNQLNHNMGRLVTLVDQQIKFFSTMQARGWSPPGQSRSDRHQQPAESANVNPASARRLRRRVARDPKPTELPSTRDAKAVSLSSEIRNTVKKLMHRKSAKDKFHIEYMADEEEVSAFNSELGQPACTAGHFRPDLKATPGSDWNLSVTEVFVHHFVARRPAVDVDVVKKAFKRHLKYLCARYKDLLAGPAAQKQKKKDARRSSRQRELWQRRLAVAMFYPQLQGHLQILRELGPHGMSSDESDHESNGRRRYRILVKSWRNPVLGPWLRLFDKLYRIARLGASGAEVHRRVPSDVTSDRRPAVRGLPQNAYKVEWLKKLTEHDRRVISIKMGVKYQFAHSVEVQNLVSGDA